MGNTQSADPEAAPLYALMLTNGDWGRLAVYGFSSNPRLVSTSNINAATVMQRHEWNKYLKYGVIVPVKVERKVTVIPG